MPAHNLSTQVPVLDADRSEALKTMAETVEASVLGVVVGVPEAVLLVLESAAAKSDSCTALFEAKRGRFMRRMKRMEGGSFP